MISINHRLNAFYDIREVKRSGCFSMFETARKYDKNEHFLAKGEVSCILFLERMLNLTRYAILKVTNVSKRFNFWFNFEREFFKYNFKKRIKIMPVYILDIKLNIDPLKNILYNIRALSDAIFNIFYQSNEYLFSIILTV